MDATQLIRGEGLPDDEATLAGGQWCLPHLGTTVSYGDTLLQDLITGATDEQRTAGVLCIVALLRAGRSWPYESVARELLDTLAKRRLRWRSAEAEWLLAAVAHLADRSQCSMSLLRLASSAAERVEPARLGAVAAHLHRMLEVLDDPVGVWWELTAQRRVSRRLRTVLVARPGADAALSPWLLRTDDAYGAAARTAVIGAVGERAAARVLAVLDQYGEDTTPPAAWRKALDSVVRGEPVAEVARTLLTTFTHESGTAPARRDWGGQEFTEEIFVHPDTAGIVRGAVWVLAKSPEPWVTALIGAAAAHGGAGLTGGGSPRCVQVATSSLAALVERVRAGLAEPADVVAELSVCRAKIKNRSLRTTIATAVDTIGTLAGLTPRQLVERAVPGFGLGEDGSREITLGEHTGRLRVDPETGTVVLRWPGRGGRETATVPAAVKRSHGAELAELRAVARELKKAVATQRERLDGLLADDTGWPGAEWVSCYAGHPLVGLLACRLIWQVRREGGWRSGLPARSGAGWALRDHAGVVTPVCAADEVRLWHPLREPLAEVTAWRVHVDELRLRQPVKQAFREIYLLTPAEEATSPHSNRYAAHLLRYGQAGALLRGRGWAASHLGYWDGGYDGSASKEIRADWRAWFSYGLADDMPEAAVAPGLCGTGQARFERAHGAGPKASWAEAALADVPPLVFSEAMRDLDLVVGVTSIAADPTWLDRGDERHLAYWHETGFGELTESARTRRAALERLLPRTKLADRTELTDRFLIVRGTIRDYRIHLGSANVLMGPADTYLCIVPDLAGKVPAKLFLPFEEDGTLALVLAKAFLLADDHAITDPTITSQLRVDR